MQLCERLSVRYGMANVISRQAAVTIGNRLMTHRKPPKQRLPRRAAAKSKAPHLGRDIQVRIGDRLRAMYDDIVDEGVPDRFSALLRQFDDPPAGKDK
jgi:hypothetical protein